MSFLQFKLHAIKCFDVVGLETATSREDCQPEHINTDGQLLTCEDDHVHSPEDAHDPSDHDDGRQDLDEGRRHVEPEHAAHAPLGDQLAAGATQHREG